MKQKEILDENDDDEDVENKDADEDDSVSVIQNETFCPTTTKQHELESPLLLSTMF